VFVQVNLTSSNPVELKDGARLDFSYRFHAAAASAAAAHSGALTRWLSVTWKQTDALFENRFKRYLDDDFFEHQVPCCSII
jgi:hypothetical protein